ncbi:EGF, latrophilin seven transmembrane domain-containing protein 1 [Cricetulus griseus]|uniref:EGF, latrophilin seven transmembrane domain-containing protein 1 n=1 Tax=Cricetulus griseus TaxID=10029 RepID=G3GVS7_CRIGR|nr:EGF, latrophilin seven transmembrane domain-containing protein 1 [Cricetulus griseus]
MTTVTILSVVLVKYIEVLEEILKENNASYIDECSESAVCGDHAVCENVIGGFHCFCREGYQTPTGKAPFMPNDGSYCQESVNSNCHLEHDCIAANVNKTLKRIGPVQEQLAILQEIYRDSEGELSPVDIVTYIEALAQSSPVLGYMNSTASPKDDSFNSSLTEFVKIINNFVQKNTLKIWDQLPTNHRRLHLTKLMHTAELVTLRISQNFQKPTQFDLNSTDVGSVVVAFLCYKSIGPLLSPSDDFLLDSQNEDNSEEREKVISSVISASISSNPSTLYELEKITFTLSHGKVSDKYRTQCAFWNYSADAMSNGSWSSEGCELTYSNDTHTSCRCGHLTHFAILMSSSTSIGIKDYNILTRITQLGIIISLICLAMCIFTFWFFSEIQSTRTTIHKNLCCSLFLAELVFLVGININTNKLVCSIIAGLLHYFFLAAFAWMCIEGLHLYLVVVGIIYNKGFLHKNFYIFGYLSPAVVVGFSASLGYKYYGTTKV